MQEEGGILIKETKDFKQLIPNRNYRDTVFRMQFQDKKELLALFNAIHGTSYDDPAELEITTLENAVYMTMKNDISCVLDMNLDLYEHQSTVNPNMPLRDLFYVAKLFEHQIQKRDLYSHKRLMLPSPTFIVFYNGIEKQPERKIYRLSDSYKKEEKEANLELIVLQLNINLGYNEELVASCHPLFEYIHYVDQVREYRKTMPLKKAVEAAVDHCIREGILEDFLRKNRNEVVSMSIFEYDEELHLRTVHEEGIEQGNIQAAKRMLEAGKLSVSEIVLYSGLSIEQILEIKKNSNQYNYIEDNIIRL